MLIAQADPTQAIGDLVSARDVVPFQGAAILVLILALVYLFRLREQERKAHLDQLTKINESLLGREKGDTHG